MRWPGWSFLQGFDGLGVSTGSTNGDTSGRVALCAGAPDRSIKERETVLDKSSIKGIYAMTSVQLASSSQSFNCLVIPGQVPLVRFLSRRRTHVRGENISLRIAKRLNYNQHPTDSECSILQLDCA